MPNDWAAFMLTQEIRLWAQVPSGFAWSSSLDLPGDQADSQVGRELVGSQKSPDFCFALICKIFEFSLGSQKS